MADKAGRCRKRRRSRIETPTVTATTARLARIPPPPTAQVSWIGGMEIKTAATPPSAAKPMTPALKSPA